MDSREGDEINLEDGGAADSTVRMSMEMGRN